MMLETSNPELLRINSRNILLKIKYVTISDSENPCIFEFPLPAYIKPQKSKVIIIPTLLKKRLTIVLNRYSKEHNKLSLNSYRYFLIILTFLSQTAIKVN